MKTNTPSKEEIAMQDKIVLQYKKLFLFLEDRTGFYEWLCEEFCENEPWECGSCPYREKVLEAV